MYVLKVDPHSGKWTGEKQNLMRKEAACGAPGKKCSWLALEIPIIMEEEMIFQCYMGSRK